MPIIYRRLIFSFFVLLFCILVPIVLLYATGYTINWSRFSLEKTGSILIDSEPSGATVFLNNESISDSWLGIFSTKNPLLTKAKINNLAPGEYTIRLEKAGFWSWEEKFRLSPGEVANFSTIGLFSQVKPELVYELGEAKTALSPNGEKIALLKNNLLSITDINNSETKTVKLPNLENYEAINWSSDNKKIALDKFIIDLNKATIINLVKEIKKTISLIRWGNNNDIIYFVNDNKILRYTIATKIITELSLNSQLNGQNITDYLIRGDQIYIITKPSNTNQNLLIGSMEGKLISLNLPIGNYKFKTENSPKPILNNGQLLYAIDEPLAIFSKPRLLEISKNFKTGRWQDGSLTYTTGIELRRWDKEGQEYLLNRFGSPINSLVPINKKNSIIIATPDDIRVYVNGRQPFTITLAKIKNSQLVTVSQDAETLYIYGEYYGKTGIFKLTL